MANEPKPTHAGVDDQPPGTKLATCASLAIRMCQEMPLSTMELAAVFRIAAAACDEASNLQERATMINKVRGWWPGSR